MNVFRSLVYTTTALTSLLPQVAFAQWATPNHSVPVGRGAGTTGFSFAAPGPAHQPLTSNGVGSDPTFQALNVLLTVKDFGAVGDGVTDDTLAIQAAIDASCPGHLVGVVPNGQIFPVVLPGPGGATSSYKVTQLNATNCPGFNMVGWGTGALSPVIRWSTPVNAVLDLTGSNAGCTLRDFQILGPQADDINANYPAIGLLMAPTAAFGQNYCKLDGVSVQGRFRIASVYILDVCCSIMLKTGATNYNQNDGNAFGLILTGSNPSSRGTTVTSNFVNIPNTISGGISDWSMVGSEAHTFTGGMTSSGKAVFLDGATNISWIGGEIGSAGGFILQSGGNANLLGFYGTTFYTDVGPAASTWMGSASGSATRVKCEGCYIKLATGGTLFSGQSPASGMLIESTYQLGGTVTQIHFAGIGTSPTASVGTPSGSDIDGSISTSGATTGSTITFTQPFNSTSPVCTVTPQPAGFTISTSQTQLIMTWTSATVGVIGWQCHDKVT